MGLILFMKISGKCELPHYILENIYILGLLQRSENKRKYDSDIPGIFFWTQTTCAKMSQFVPYALRSGR